MGKQPEEAVMLQLVMTIADLQRRLEGASALNICLLHRLGGQLTIDKDEVDRTVTEFNTIDFSVSNDRICVKLSSTPEGVKS